MGDNKSLKHNLGNFFQAAKSTLTNTLHSLNSHSVASSNTCDADSTSLMCSLSSVAQKPNFEGITLIWYDPRISKTEDTKLTSEELREINDCVIEHSDQVDCVNYMRSVENEKIFLITSGKAAMSILPEIQQLKQVDSIFIFCLKVEKYQHLLETYDSIVGIYSERSSLINSIKQNVELLQKQLNAFSFYNEHEEKATRDISKESAEFLWFQLFKDILLQMPRNDQAKQELIDFAHQYYRGNPKEYKNITEFSQSYKLDKSIYWYTKDSFLYRLVNKALRTEDVGQLHIFRFFISDLSSKLAKIHTKQNREQKTTIMLYRGLKMEIDELNRLKQNLGSIISANGFLSTSHSKGVAIKFASLSTKRKNLAPVLYEIECNLDASKSVIFADITKYSEFANEQEVLFDLGSTFKIESITHDQELKMVVVKLIATDAGMKMAQKYIELNRKMNEETTPDILFGILLIQMGKYDQSLSYFGNLSKESNGKIDIARIYNEIGSTYLCKGELDKAFENADHAYQIMIKVKPSRIKDSSRPMTTMAHVYLRRKIYEKSLDFYFEALEIREKFCGPKHLDTSVALNHIGNVYYEMEDYSKSLTYYQKAFEIRKKKLPNVHLAIAASLNNLGLIYWKTNHVDNALDYHRQSLDIRKQLLPSDHNDIIQSLDNIARILYEENRNDESLEYFTEALTIQKINFDPNDRNNLLSRLEEKFGLRPKRELKLKDEEKRWPQYAFAEVTIKSFISPHPHEGCPCIDYTKQQEDDSILKNFIKILDNDGDDDMGLEAVTQIQMLASKTFQCNYCHIKYLMNYLRDLVSHAYLTSDESIKALRFYDNVKFILGREISHWAGIKDIESICSERIQQKIQRDHSILKDFIEILDNDGDYGMALEAVREILIASHRTLISGYNHSQDLMACLRDLVKDVYDSTDESIKALRFYEKVESLLESTISHWADTNDIQIICLERIGYIQQLNANYESAVESLEQSVKIQRDNKKSSDDISDKLRCIGLLHMTLGNYKSALISFNDALKLLQLNSAENDREINLLLKRIEQVREELKSTTDMLE